MGEKSYDAILYEPLIQGSFDSFNVESDYKGFHYDKNYEVPWLCVFSLLINIIDNLSVSYIT